MAGHARVVEDEPVVGTPPDRQRGPLDGDRAFAAVGPDLAQQRLGRVDDGLAIEEGARRIGGLGLRRHAGGSIGSATDARLAPLIADAGAAAAIAPAAPVAIAGAPAQPWTAVDGRAASAALKDGGWPARSPKRASTSASPGRTDGSATRLTVGRSARW